MSLSSKTQIEQDAFFWKVIEESNKQEGEGWEGYDDDQHIDEIVDVLSKTDKDHLIVFEKVMQQKLHELYTAEIAELYIILLCDFSVEEDVIEFDESISDDAFIYFRCWLLLRGQDFFNDVKENIENFISGDYSFNIADCDGEELLYVADAANEAMNGIEESEEIRDIIFERYPDVVNYDNEEGEMNRAINGGTELQKMYPELVEEICDIRAEGEEAEDNKE